MEKRFIFKGEDGGVVVGIPSPECLQLYSIEQIARRDIPSGVPFKIVNVSDIPTDRTFRNAWEINESALTDGVGNSSNTF